MAKECARVTDILKDIEKRHGLRIGAVSNVVDEVQGLTTGNLAIDYVTGIGGLPLGRSVELYGLPSSGKTTTAIQTAAHLQSKIINEGLDEYILYLDFEHTFDEDYAVALGLDTEHPSFLLGQPTTMEEGAESALKLIETGQIRMSIWDSVAAMAPISRLEGDFDQRTAAMNKARLMSGLLLQLTGLQHKKLCTSVFINHLMEAVEMTGRAGLPAKTDTPGGKGLKYYTSLRLEFRQMGNTRGKLVDPLTGQTGLGTTATHVKVKAVKNKVGKPFREAEIRINYGKGFDNVWSALQVLLAYKAGVRKEGAWYKFDGALAHSEMQPSTGEKTMLQGEAAVLDFAADHPQWRHLLIHAGTDLLALHADDNHVFADTEATSLVGDSDL